MALVTASRWGDRDKIFDLESELEKEAVAFSKRHNWLTRKFKHPGRRAAPDRWFAKAGRIFWVEFKRLGNAPTEQQEEEIKEMRDNGLDVVWLDSIEDFRAVMACREC